MSKYMIEEWLEEKAAYIRGQGVGQNGPVQRDFGASSCVCPKCGYEESHVKSIPCNKKKCPTCDVPLVGSSELPNSTMGLGRGRGLGRSPGGGLGRRY